MLAWFTARLSFVHYPKISPYLCVSISVVLWLPTAPSLSPLPSSSLQDSNQDGEEAGEEEDDDDDGGQQCWDATLRPAVHTPSPPPPAPPAACRPFLLSSHPHVHTHSCTRKHTLYITSTKSVSPLPAFRETWRFIFYQCAASLGRPHFLIFHTVCVLGFNSSLIGQSGMFVQHFHCLKIL